MKACHPSEEVAEQTTVQDSWLTLSSSSNVWASFGEIYSDTIWLMAPGGYVLVKFIVKEVGGHFLSNSKQYCSVIDVPSKAQL